MASEYLKWKYRDVQPREKVELTPAQRRKNWWYYHKWHIAVGVVLAGIAASILWSALGIGQIKPDYQVAYVGKNALPDDTAAAVEAAFASLGEDLNGDGRVAVCLNQYTSAAGGDPSMAMAADAAFIADLVECESYFFLLEDPEKFQEERRCLRRLDGTLPEEGDGSADSVCVAWAQCPALAGLELGEYSFQLLDETVTGDNAALVSGLFLARRGFWTDKTSAYPEGCDALWARLTEGALP